jgi:hypothetical protein
MRHVSCSSWASWRNLGLGAIALCAGAFPLQSTEAAEYGTGPWVKGYSDMFAGVLPSVPGIYVRNDAYHYEGDAQKLIFDGLIQAGVQERYMADILAISVVTPAKILGGTYAVAFVPSFISMNVDVDIGIDPFRLRRNVGPFGPGDLVGPFDFNFGDSKMSQGDSVIAPVILGWDEGNFHWNVATFVFAPTGDYDRRDLANTSLNRWAVMPHVAGTYFDPKTGWQASGAATYTFNWQNPATDYETGDIVNLEGTVTKNFGALGVGVASYAMIQVTGDSGTGARLGSFESSVYGVGPIVSYTLGAGTATPLTLLAKWYHEFDAENTFEGDVIDAAASFKF